MGVTRFPHGISSFGVPVLGGAGTIPQTTGTYYFVDDSGSNANDGKDTDHPFADLNYAISQCTADVGDVIILMPGHAETASAIAVDVPGITVIGLGHGEAMPTITATDAAGADLIDVTVDSFWMDNVKLVGGASATTALIDLSGDADFFKATNCYFLSGAAAPVDLITMAAAADDITFENCKFIGDGSELDTFIMCEGGTERMHIINCLFDSLEASGIDDAAIYISLSSTGVLIDHCTFINDAAGVTVKSPSSTTGLITNTSILTDDASGILTVTDNFGVIQSYAAEVGKFAGGAMLTSSTQPQGTPAA